jgi:hypothetical protein
MRNIIAVLLLIFVTQWLDADDNLIGSVPDGWRKETFSFPLEFAPEIHLTGTEEVHFAPGMFDTNAADYFNYIFLWRLEGKNSFTQEQYTKYLEFYYRGLYLAVSQSPDKKEKNTLLSYQFITEENGQLHFKGKWFDAFNKDHIVELNISIEEAYCSQQNVSNILFRITATGHQSAQKTLNNMTFPQCE